MQILRYLNREVVHAMLAVVTILLVLVISNMFIRYLNIAASGGLTGSAVIQLLGIMLPKYIAYLLPVSYFFSILLVYGRLFSNNELTVAFACGMSWLRLLAITFFPILFIFIVECYLSLSLIPYMLSFKNSVQNNVSSENVLNFLQPGKIMTFNDGKQVIYVERIDTTDNTLHNVFIYQQNDKPSDGKAQKAVTIVAPSGHQQTDAKGNKYVVLENGYFYQGIPGEDNYQQAKFKTASQFIDTGNQNSSRYQSYESMPLIQLMEDHSIEASSEFQWRFSFPIALFVTTMIAVALCKVNPRQGRYGRILPAVIVFVAYFNLLSIAKSWLDSGYIPPWIGLWWVHLLFGLVALMVILKLNGPIFSYQPMAKKKKITGNKNA
ncbi:LPS export ABC transporter permease LptF [Thiotrichales bacterium 19S3-7]|nr:LPS export ABC transporter permease LptF [Thiotrichales bacterium 19S3-7]MCF6801269.1 LPS export ABC transporter permease LptF [Thiotrichales bacterium 19S3-11]